MKEKQPYRKLNVRFPPGMLEELGPLAEQDSRSLNGEIVQAVREFIARKKGALEGHEKEIPDRLSEKA